ncbi:7e48b72b-33fa-41f5-b299-dddf84051c35-CDS [Sclerotinia trifoliorum]|uniref:EKC/KEOPS complex subunit BUD32 n=1 Tax=Sclerotinia trifoliorum TaxID=28548 RepID=A0A8H2VXZ7_9HELO|nr:7e48b72b-33fa-41f5-b299-dddf84051c35-CDS [Sclerotinia trifoliorum]
MVLFVAEEKAVAYKRAAPTFKIRDNIHRKQHRLNPEEIRFDTHLRISGNSFHFGITDTGTAGHRQYDLKLQVIQDEGPWSPPLSPGSEDTEQSPTKVESESYDAKRQHEIRTYLRYIKNGHENIKNLEAFHQYRDGDKLMMAQFFRICDGGNLKQLRMGYREKEMIPPEQFIWRIYSQLIEALAFLHNEHPKYQNDPRHLNRPSILHPDLAAENVYLVWPFMQPRDDIYPDVRLGDFEKSLFVPIGKGVVIDDPDADPKYKPPEVNFISAKSDVWRAGSIMYSLTKPPESTSTKMPWITEQNKSFANLTKEHQQVILMDPRRVHPIKFNYSEDLNVMIQRSLVLDHNKRPSAGELLKELENPAKLRKSAAWMYKALPSWMVDKVITPNNTFSQERLNKLIQPDQMALARKAHKKAKAAKRNRMREEEERKRVEDSREEEILEAADRYFTWEFRESDLGRMEIVMDNDECDASIKRFAVIRAAGLKAGTWVEPGPTYEEFLRLEKIYLAVKDQASQTK